MMKTSDSLILRLTAYLDDEMSPEERARFESDLATDPELADMLEAAQEAMSVVTKAPPPRAPENFDLAVKRRIRRRSRGRFFVEDRGRLDGSMLFAVVALAFLFVWLYLEFPSRIGMLLDDPLPEDQGGGPQEASGTTEGSAPAAGSAPAVAPEAGSGAAVPALEVPSETR